VFALGLAAAILASLLFNLGMALQALEARRAPRELALRASLLVRLLRRPLWLVGSALGLLGIVPQVAALAWAPFVVVQVALAAGLLVLLALAARWLGERPGALEYAGVAAMIAGIAAVAWGSPPHVETHRGGIDVIAVAAGLTAGAAAPWLLRRTPLGSSALLLMVASGFGFAATNVATKLAADDVSLEHWGNAAAWGVVLVVTGILAVLTQMSAFQVAAATIVIPVGFAVQTFLPIALEPLFLHEPLGGERLLGAPILAGLGLLLAGTVVIARNQAVAELSAGGAQP
jgi:drug/metabolite transporter (DMT)-like permease